MRSLGTRTLPHLRRFPVQLPQPLPAPPGSRVPQRYVQRPRQRQTLRRHGAGGAMSALRRGLRGRAEVRLRGKARAQGVAGQRVGPPTGDPGRTARRLRRRKSHHQQSARVHVSCARTAGCVRYRKHLYVSALPCNRVCF